MVIYSEEFEGYTVFDINVKGSDEPIKMMCLKDVKQILKVDKMLKNVDEEFITKDGRKVNKKQFFTEAIETIALLPIEDDEEKTIYEILEKYIDG